MAETLREIVARAIFDSDMDDFGMGAASVALAALRDPPPETIEAGAKALYKTDDGDAYTDEDWRRLSEEGRQWWRGAFLASWRAAIDGKE